MYGEIIYKYFRGVGGWIGTPRLLEIKASSRSSASSSSSHLDVSHVNPKGLARAIDTVHALDLDMQLRCPRLGSQHDPCSL